MDKILFKKQLRMVQGCARPPHDRRDRMAQLLRALLLIELLQYAES
jgi:hypothetical protein